MGDGHSGENKWKFREHVDLDFKTLQKKICTWVYMSRASHDLTTQRPHAHPQLSHQMASGANLPFPRHNAPSSSATSSLRESHPGTPSHEDDEHAPLLRPSDIERAAYSDARRSQNR